MSEPTNGGTAGGPRVRPVGAAVARPDAATRAAPDWDLVRKRNNVEKLKYEKHPLKILDEVPALGAMDYNDVSEEDMVRFQWYGLYHDKPKVGLMMLRIKVPAGHLTATQLRVIGGLSEQVLAKQPNPFGVGLIIALPCEIARRRERAMCGCAGERDPDHPAFA